MPLPFRPNGIYENLSTPPRRNTSFFHQKGYELSFNGLNARRFCEFHLFGYHFPWSMGSRLRGKIETILGWIKWDGVYYYIVAAVVLNLVSVWHYLLSQRWTDF